MTILFDNHPGSAGSTPLWGFAALVETGERTILFDTGSNGRVLLRNMETLGLSSASIDLLFLSHAHWDHTGGLDSVLEVNERVTVVLHEGFSAHFIEDLRRLCRDVVVVGAEPCELAPGIFSTGRFDSRPAEHGMLLELGGVTAAISGCAHPGIERMVERGVALLGKPIRWAIGGFHLVSTDRASIERCAHRLQELGVTDVVPTHCTGDAAWEVFRTAYGEHCGGGGIGRTVDLSSYGEPEGVACV